MPSPLPHLSIEPGRNRFTFPECSRLLVHHFRGVATFTPNRDFKLLSFHASSTRSTGASPRHPFPASGTAQHRQKFFILSTGGMTIMGHRRRGDGMSEAGRTTAARLRHAWRSLRSGPECAGRVQVHLDGVATCNGRCEHIEGTYHAARPIACRGKRGSAVETCARCAGRASLDLPSLIGTATNLVQVVDVMRRALTPDHPPTGSTRASAKPSTDGSDDSGR